MATSPVEAEARGDKFIEATFGGNTFRVPLDVDCWPLDIVRQCRGVSVSTGSPVVNGAQLVSVLGALLGPQWVELAAVARKKRQLVAASQVFAEAVGIPATGKSDVVFGGIPRLLALIDTYPREVESDLGRFWHLDYVDRWRFTRGGRRRLTLRQIAARLERVPVDSALAIAMNGGKLLYSNTDLLLMDLFELSSRTRHPSRPMSAAEIAERDKQKVQDEKNRAAHKERMEKRKSRQGLENARANARRNQERETHAQTQD